MCLCFDRYYPRTVAGRPAYSACGAIAAGMVHTRAAAVRAVAGHAAVTRRADASGRAPAAVATTAAIAAISCLIREPTLAPFTALATGAASGLVVARDRAVCGDRSAADKHSSAISSASLTARATGPRDAWNSIIAAAPPSAACPTVAAVDPERPFLTVTRRHRLGLLARPHHPPRPRPLLHRRLPRLDRHRSNRH